ncbi:MAG: mechanosensitive ion channel family protein [Oscillospiraceae bacterium]|nr:mechanosensitive ion channel family protein [Oscillospiraceae bacterium]
MPFFNSLKEIYIGTMPLSTLFGALITFLVCLIVISIILKLVSRALNSAKRMGRTMKNFLLSAVKIGLWIIAVIIIAGELGIPTASLVALLSVAGLALSLSVQGLLGNLFSGLTLLMTHPFNEGDFVEVAGKTGVVKSIGLLYTTVNTLDNVVISIPNSDVIGSAINNYSADPLRRVDMLFSAAYSEPTEKVKSAIMEVIQADSRILDDPAPFVALNDYKDSVVEYVVRVWVKNADYWDVHFSLNEKVRESFARNGVAMSYAHVNVHLVEK